MIDFEDEVNLVEIIEVSLDDEDDVVAIGVMVDPDKEHAYFAELYLEDYGNWSVVIFHE